MHLFLYQANRHQTRNSYRNRLSQSTIRCDFDLDLLKRGIKGRYRILGHGTHDFQKVLEKMGMEDEFYGHVIEIEEPKNAVWFKLNYDQIGKHTTKYLGGWKDLDPNDISHLVDEYVEAKSKYNQTDRLLSTIRNQRYTLSGYLRTVVPCEEDVDIVKPLTDLGNQYHDVLQATYGVLEKKIEERHQVLKDIRDRVKEYINSKVL